MPRSPTAEESETHPHESDSLISRRSWRFDLASARRGEGPNFRRIVLAAAAWSLFVFVCWAFAPESTNSGGNVIRGSVLEEGDEENNDQVSDSRSDSNATQLSTFPASSPPVIPPTTDLEKPLPTNNDDDDDDDGERPPWAGNDESFDDEDADGGPDDAPNQQDTEVMLEPTGEEEEEDGNVTTPFTSVSLNATTNTRHGTILMSQLESNCPAWSKEFAARFRATCGVWTDVLASWQAAGSAALAHHKKPSSVNLLRTGSSFYACLKESSCKGLGDRFAGLLGALSYAIIHRKPFRLAWTGLDWSFRPCALRGFNAAWPNGVTRDLMHALRRIELCTPSSKTHCKDILPIQCRTAVEPRVFLDIDRSCVPPGVCETLHARNQTNVAEAFGCPLRALFEPTGRFMNVMKVPFREGTNPVRDMTIAEILEVMSKYHVIGIHFRLGDLLSFTGGKHTAIGPQHHQFLIPFRCAETLQSYAEGRSVNTSAPPFDASGVHGEDLALRAGGRGERLARKDGKPVRWFLASDSQELRDMAVQLFGDRILMLAITPRHVSSVTAAEAHAGTTLANTLAEWLLLGMVDEAVLNRFTQKREILFAGRMSSFPKTSLAYQLKNDFVDAIDCKRKHIPFDGTWGRDAGVMTCRERDAPQDLPLALQPHLAALSRAGLEFPYAWVVEGNIHLDTHARDYVEKEKLREYAL